MCEEVLGPVSAAVPIVTSNNVTGDVFELPYELTVTPLGPVVDGVPVDIAFTGTAFFPPTFLNAAIATIPGLTEVTLADVSATPYVRSGAVGAPFDLATLGSLEPLPMQVPIPLTTDPAICGPLNLATCQNSCEDGTSCVQPDAGAVCGAIGDGSCLPRGDCACVVEYLPITLSTEIVSITPSGAGGALLFGWNEDLLPPQTVIVTNPVGANGIRILAVVLQVGIEGWMGELVGEAPGIPAPLPDGQLLPIPIGP